MFYSFIGDDTHVSHMFVLLDLTLYLSQIAVVTTESEDISFPLFVFTIKRDLLIFQLWCAYIAHYSCATADTWASEVGILAKGNPRLVTSLFLRAVPPGTNGGMSPLGTAASAAGGLFIGLVFYIGALALQLGSPDSPPPILSQFPMVYVGTICGILGSLFDSLLGATLQASYYSKDRKCIVKKSDPLFASDKSIQLICGLDILSNEQVNGLSILLTMLCSVNIGRFVFCMTSMCID